MKNRRFPYGYEMLNGTVSVCKEEADTVKRIFDRYLSGCNLKEIAESLSSRKIEYLTGEYRWNKSRIKRIIEDTRYVGGKNYPTILSQDVFGRANSEKETRRRYDAPVSTAENKLLLHMTYCSDCGGRLRHKTDSRLRYKERWFCRNKECGDSIPMSLSELEREITSILNLLAADPGLAEYADTDIFSEPSLEIRKQENEIERRLSSPDSDKDGLQNMILQCAAKKYDEYISVRHITDRIKADFEKSGPLSEFNTDLFERTVAEVLLGSNGTVGLKLKNNKEIRKETTANDTDRNYAKNGSGYTA